jgi:protocatechuate 3,4-dioxygenase beta subunit
MMKTIKSNKNNVLIFALVVILTAALVVGCASQPPAAATAGEPTQASSPPTTAAAAAEEATLPPIPTRAIGFSSTSMVLIEQPGEKTPTATPPAPAAAPEINCTAPAVLTAAGTEGPYFTAGSPETTNLLQAGMPGTKLVLTGYVLTPDCQPVVHALIDFWQADSNGQYDNSGYTLRGHQYTDDSGRYQLVSVVPGLYPGRTEHIHVKVQAPNGPVLTTQLFFPDVQANQSDSIYDPTLLMSIQETADGVQGAFNFIVAP